MIAKTEVASLSNGLDPLEQLAGKCFLALDF